MNATKAEGGGIADKRSSRRVPFRENVKLELIQFTPTFPGRAENWKRILASAERTSADIVLFPELSACGYMYNDADEIRPFSDLRSALAPLETLSRKTGKLIVGGFAERANGTLFNATYAVAPQGTTVYRKIHLWNREKLLFEPGEDPCIIEYDGRRIGIEICYDLQFPELAAYLARRGAELILAPTAWAQDDHGPSRGLHPHAFLAMATAYAYGICVAVANRTGRERGAFFPGQSCLCDPWGKILTLGEEEESRVVDIPFDAVPGAKRPSPRNDLQTDPRMAILPPGRGEGTKPLRQKGSGRPPRTKG